VPSAPPGGSVGAVVVHYRNSDDTTTCLASLFEATPCPGGVAVVDNSPGDGSLERVESWLAGRDVRWRKVAAAQEPWPELAALPPELGQPRVVLVVAPANLGFGAGVNLGWRALHALPGIEHLLILNNDATVSRGFLPPLLQAVGERADVGLVAATIRYAPPRDGVWFAGGEIIWSQCRGRHWHRPSAEPREITFCTGCFMLVRGDAIRRLGGLPECYFLYLEDTEFCVRLRRAGYRLVHVPAAIVHHAVGASAGKRRESPFISFLSARNRCWFARRNLSRWQKPVALARVAVDELGRAVGALFRGRPDVARSIARGVAVGLRGSWSGPGTALAGAP
jgi:GT2 family glycosyltransferase